MHREEKPCMIYVFSALFTAIVWWNGTTYRKQQRRLEKPLTINDKTCAGEHVNGVCLLLLLIESEPEKTRFWIECNVFCFVEFIWFKRPANTRAKWAIIVKNSTTEINEKLRRKCLRDEMNADTDRYRKASSTSFVLSIIMQNVYHWKSAKDRKIIYPNSSMHRFRHQFYSGTQLTNRWTNNNFLVFATIKNIVCRLRVQSGPFHVQKNPHHISKFISHYHYIVLAKRSIEDRQGISQQLGTQEIQIRAVLPRNNAMFFIQNSVYWTLDGTLCQI